MRWPYLLLLCSIASWWVLLTIIETFKAMAVALG